MNFIDFIEIFMAFEERILKCEAAKRWALLFSYYLKLILIEAEVKHEIYSISLKTFTKEPKPAHKQSGTLRS